MKYVKMAKVSDFAHARCKSYKILARNVAIIKDSDGTFYATESSCKHQNWDLTTGRIEGDIAVCPRHGWTYNMRTGECLDHDSTPLRRYGCKVEGEDILVTLLPLEE